MQAAVTMILEAPPIFLAISSQLSSFIRLAVSIFSVTSARFIVVSPRLACSMRLPERHDFGRRIDRGQARLHQLQPARVVAAVRDLLVERLGAVDQELHEMIANGVVLRMSMQVVPVPFVALHGV